MFYALRNWNFLLSLALILAITKFFHQTIPLLRLIRSIRTITLCIREFYLVFLLLIFLFTNKDKIGSIIKLKSDGISPVFPWNTKERSAESSNYVLLVWLKAQLWKSTAREYLQIFAYMFAQTISNKNWESSHTFYFKRGSLWQRTCTGTRCQPNDSINIETVCK